MEAVGAVAATAQLVGMAMKTLELIANLHSIIKDVSARYEDWNTKLTTLEDLIRIIQGNPSLQTQSVERAIASMSLKVENLIVLCTMHVPRTGSRGLSKLLKCLTARAAEPRIHQSFQSLEQDKTSLLLVINASEVHTWKPEILPPNPPEDNQENQVDASPPSSGSFTPVSLFSLLHPFLFSFVLHLNYTFHYLCTIPTHEILVTRFKSYAQYVHSS